MNTGKSCAQGRIGKSVLLTAIGVAGALGAAPARAQKTGLLPIRAKIGVFLPQGDAKDFAGSTHFNAEVDLALPSLGAGRTMVSAGYYRGSSDGRRFEMIPVTVSRLFSPPNPAASLTGNIYFGAGVGAYFLRASGGGISENKVRPGAFGVVGYQFPNPFFLEAKYHVAGSVGGISPRGLAVMVGRRF